MTLFEVDDTLTVGQLNRQIGEAVRRVASNDIWVRGQIRNLTRSARRHVYFDLIDPVEAGSMPKAAISVTLFDSQRQIVNRILTRAGNNVRIADGVEVRVRASLDFYAPRGQVQLIMNSIDPEFTLGRLSVDREQLLQALRDEDLLDRNARLTLGQAPLRVALVTSENSAAWADFTQQLASSPYAFTVQTFDTRVQGEAAGDELAAAITFAARSEVDVVVVTRGGGARTDLALFDTEGVARAIAEASKPVIAGIGHEIDDSVADHVAHTSCKTPTAAAQFLIDRVALFDLAVTERADRLIEVAPRAAALAALRNDAARHRLHASVGAALSEATTRLVSAGHGVEQRAAMLLSAASAGLIEHQAALTHAAAMRPSEAAVRVDRAAAQLGTTSSTRFRSHSARLDIANATVAALNPERALRRGWSITRDRDGRVVRSRRQAMAGDVLVTRVADGAITSTVVESNPTDEEST